MSQPNTDPPTASESPTSPVYVESPDHFRSVVADHDVVLVDFYADWCGPCVVLDEHVQAIAEETAATVAKVDVDAQQRLAGEFGVRSIPTVVLFADGEVVERLVGLQDRATLERVVAQHAD